MYYPHFILQLNQSYSPIKNKNNFWKLYNFSLYRINVQMFKLLKWRSFNNLFLPWIESDGYLHLCWRVSFLTFSPSWSSLSQPISCRYSSGSKSIGLYKLSSSGVNLSTSSLTPGIKIRPFWSTTLLNKCTKSIIASCLITKVINYLLNFFSE